MLSPFVRANSARSDVDRGAAMVVALVATMVVLGFGVVILQIVQADLGAVGDRVDREEALLHAEFALTEAVARVADGQEGLYRGDGTVDGDAYSYDITPGGTDTWTIVGRAGAGPAERTLTTTLRRDVTPGSADEYALWAETIDSTDAAGIVSGLIGASGSMDLDGGSVGAEQHLLNGATCAGCATPVAITSYTPPTVPTPVSPSPCPYSNSDRIRNTTIAAGHYSCGGNRLRIQGDVELAGPVVIHLDPGTRVEITNASVNAAGDPDDLWIVQTSDGGAGDSLLDDATFVGHISMPEARMEFTDLVGWSGRIVVEYAELNQPVLAALWDPAGGSGGWTTDSGYALWADEIEVEDTDGVAFALLGAAVEMDVDNGTAGVQQHLLPGATCSGCADPTAISSYTGPTVPTPVDLQPCPFTDDEEISDTTIAAGHYSCGGEELKFEGDIVLGGPVVIHLDDDTAIEIEDATINAGGDPDDFWIVQTSVDDADTSKFEDSTVIGNIWMPEAEIEIEGDAVWSGRIVVDKAEVKDATIAAVWNENAGTTGGAGGGGTPTISWSIDPWSD